MYENSFETRIQEHCRAIDSLVSLRETVLRISGVTRECLQSGGKILACGNGGSAAEAQHLCTELTGRYRSNRRALPALGLTADSTALTCIGNDFGWENIFARQVEAFANPLDLVFVFSTSGNSPNVVQALDRARTMNLQSVAFLGKDGGKAKTLATHSLVVGSQDTGAIQEAHLVAIHILCEGLEGM